MFFYPIGCPQVEWTVFHLLTLKQWCMMSIKTQHNPLYTPIPPPYHHHFLIFSLECAPECCILYPSPSSS